MPFAGLRVLSLESRRAKEMDALIRKHGGVPLVAPSVQERALEDASDAWRFLERLEAGEFDLLVCMTASGLAFWRDQLSPHLSRERLSDALRKVTIVSRGPKPLSVLHELGVGADIVVPEPNTWKEIVTVIGQRPERRIAVQEYGRPNLEMNGTLRALGATVTPAMIYRWELPEDMRPLQEAARRLAAAALDVVLFTSSIQFDHLMLTAQKLGLEEPVRRALATCVIASVGPVMTATLEAAGIQVDIVPVHPKMAALVKAAAEAAAEAIARKAARWR